MIRSYYDQYPEYREKISKFLPLFYEQLFGYEFSKFDSFWNVENGGVSYCYPYQEGESRSYKAQRLTTPRVSIVDNLLYETPFYVQWKRGDARKHQILRKSVYKNTQLMQSSTFEYSNPRIKLNKTRSPSFSIAQKAISDWYDLKLITQHGYTMGKVTFNLFGQELHRALVQCSRAPNPFEAYATGGYTNLTAWRAPPVVSSELQYLVELFNQNISLIETRLVSRFDIDNVDVEEILGTRPEKRKSTKTVDYKSKVSLSEPVPGEGPVPYKTISFNSSMIISLPEQRGDIISNAVSIIGDLKGRQDETSEHFIFNEEEDNYSINDFEEVDDSFYDN